MRGVVSFINNSFVINSFTMNINKNINGEGRGRHHEQRGEEQPGTHGRIIYHFRLVISTNERFR